MKVMMTVAAVAMMVTGFAQSVSIWRGETAAFSVEDNVELDLSAAPEWMKVRVGSAKAVKYLESPRDPQFAQALDKVVWGDNSGAHRWIEIAISAEAQTDGAVNLGGLAVVVVDQTLPPAKEWKYHLDLWQHPWAVARYFGVKPFSREHYAKMEPLWRMLANAGQKVLTTTIVDQPWNHQCHDAYGSMIARTRRNDGSWTFDYSRFDEYVEFGRKCGIGPDIACYTMCPWEYRVNWTDESGKQHREAAKPGTAFFEEYWGAFLEDFAKHLKEKGWFEDTYIAMDEREPDDVRNIVELIAKKAKGFKTSMAGNLKPSEFKGIKLDNYCSFLRYITPEYLAEVPARRNAGMKTTFYVCCSPDKPNTFMKSRDGEAFWLGVYPAFVGLDGFLRWAYNSWPKNPDEDASYGHWQAGDTFVVYPDGNPSMRFLELRRGIVAAEKMRILRENECLNLKDFETIKNAFLAEGASLTSLRERVEWFINRRNVKRVSAPKN